MNKINKGITFFFGYELPKKDYAKRIKAAGFDCVITNADRKYNKQNGSISKQVKQLKANGLAPSSLHNRYVTKELPNFFLIIELETNLKKL